MSFYFLIGNLRKELVLVIDFCSYFLESCLILLVLIRSMQRLR